MARSRLNGQIHGVAVLLFVELHADHSGNHKFAGREQVGDVREPFPGDVSSLYGRIDAACFDGHGIAADRKHTAYDQDPGLDTSGFVILLLTEKHSGFSAADRRTVSDIHGGGQKVHGRTEDALHEKLNGPRGILVLRPLAGDHFADRDKNTHTLEVNGADGSCGIGSLDVADDTSQDLLPPHCISKIVPFGFFTIFACEADFFLIQAKNVLIIRCPASRRFDRRRGRGFLSFRFGLRGNVGRTRFRLGDLRIGLFSGHCLLLLSKDIAFVDAL